MGRVSRAILFLLACAVSALSAAAADDALTLSSAACTISFSKSNGSVLALTQKDQPGAILRSGEYGLWHVRFQDGSTLRAADFSSDSGERAFKIDAAEPGTLRLSYRSPDIVVQVTAACGAGGLDFAGQVAPQKKVLLDFSLPARLRFEASQVQRFVCPMNGNFSVGAAFTPAFFQEQSLEQPSSWQKGSISGPKGYSALYGGPLDQRADHDAPVALQASAEGRKWLGDALAQRIAGAKAVVNRPPTRAQAELVLVDSPNGPYFSAWHGPPAHEEAHAAGRLWRIGGSVGEKEKGLVAEMVTAVAARLAAGTVEGRGVIGLIALENGPESGAWASVPVREWASRLARLPAAGKAVVFSELKTTQALERALLADNFTFILNPYGEWFPVLPGKDMSASVAAIGRYVSRGGNWFEVGGYPFFYELQPVRYFHWALSYPPAFSDFLHLETKNGSAALYGVQLQKWPPWEGARNKEAIFVPGQLGCGADEQGGYFERAFGTYIAPGASWSAPAVRLSVGRNAFEELDSYCQANEIQRRLEDKVSPEVLRKLKDAVLVYYAGNAREKLEYLGLLPVPALLHFADYLKGGFDKQYPDHLPPHPDFGTPQELRAFFDRAHQLGHLVSPYTNPTWWCDGPKGPTFEREGSAPLLKNFAGQPCFERYEANEGWTVCHWHPAVQAANRETVRLFAEDFPVDVLFQDQCGARGWSYDTNPASPTPYAYSDGLISMVAEDCRRKPLGTEAGWDRVVNYETQLCGLSFQIVPTDYSPAWLRPMKREYPPKTWDVFPLAQRIAHDKTILLHHDLGQFVTNRQVLAWTLGLGFSLSYRVSGAGLTHDATREWLKWLDRLQKSVCARYIGQPVTNFTHDRGPEPALEDDGLIRAAYGPVQLAANLGPKPRTENGRELPPYGFYATAPGMAAANLKK
ncbi:MAG: alpha-amylase family protein, partial [Planctomycetota bacterium]